MMLDQYFVFLHEGEWKISHDEKQDGPYVIQRAAITAAVARARMAAKRGKRSQVMVQEEEGNSFREEWSFQSEMREGPALRRPARRN